MSTSALAAANQAPSTKAKILLSSGGTYEHATPGAGGTAAGAWRYVGGETRLVATSRTTRFSQFLAQLARATQDVWDESCRLMYELPGSIGASGSGPGAGGAPVLVDLVDDEDLANMWEEVDGAAALNPGFKARVYAQLGGKNRSSGGGGSAGSYACNSAESNVAVSRTPQQAREAVTPGKSGSDGSAGSAPDGRGALPPAAPDGVGSGGGSCSASVSTRSGSGGCEPCADAARGAASGHVRPAATAPPRAGGAAASPFAAVQTAPAESCAPVLALRDLESRLEIIRPEDLRVIKLLGSGGFGEVYLARWHSSEVAVKCLNPLLLTPDGDMGSVSRDTVAELLREANTLAGLRHPNIVWVFGLVLPAATAEEVAATTSGGSGSDVAGDGGAPSSFGGGSGGRTDLVGLATMVANRFEPRSGAVRPPALVTEYLGAGSLRGAISRRADFLRSDSVRIKLALDTARGIEYLHSKRLVHFDLKSANLLVGFRERTPCCKVADFGLSKQKLATYVSGVTSLRGTLPWTAPEIIRTPREVDEKVDVFSFGVVLWELWTLREPFEGINYHALLHMTSVATEPVRPAMPGAPDWEGDCPAQPAPGWSELMQDCWSERPSDRPPFAAVVPRLEEMARANKLAKRRGVTT